MNKATSLQPLAGIKIIELSNMITCSLAAMTMSAQGADVIKVEPPGMGDKMRPLGTQKNGVSGFFHNCNRGKRSLAIDLKSQAGVDAVKELASGADILIHNYRPGVMDRLGLGSDDLRNENPKLIYIAISGFGTSGPMADLPAFDHVIQGIAGFTDLQSSEEDSFDHIKTFICDKVTAYTACQAATAALLARTNTNCGQHIDISMLHACLSFMWPDGMMHRTLKDDDRFEMSPGSDYFQTINYSDGGIAVAPLTDAHWETLLPMLGYPELIGTPIYASVAARMSNMKEVLKVLSDAKPPKIFYSLNIVQNKFFELLKNKKYSGDRALSASVEYVAQRFNNEISNFFTYIPMLKNELHINATEQEKKDVNKVLEIMTGWIESTAWGMIADKYTHERNDINTFINLLNNI